jgi:hypothetical protein
MAARMKMTFFWVIAPSCLTEVYRSFTSAYRFHHQGNEKPHPEKRFVDHEQAGTGRITSMIEAVNTSETSVSSTRLHAAICQKTFITLKSTFH